MSEQVNFDLSNYGDLDIRDGVCAGIDELYPPTALDGEEEFTERKAREDKYYENAYQEIDILFHQADALFTLVNSNAQRIIEVFGGIDMCRQVFGDFTTDYMLEKIIEQQ